MSKKRFYLLFTSLLLAICLFPCVSLTAQAEVKGSSVVMEVTSRRVLSGENIHEKMPMASTTKILTAILLIEDVSLSDEVKIPTEAAGVEGSSVYLKAGEIYTVEDLLYGLMLRSGNDCSVALALYHSGSIQAFAEEMNERAKAMGATNSHFVNPNGLPGDDHYTTAYDLALISSYAMQNDTFKKIVSTTYYAPRGWQNKNKMLSRYEGANGVKTGYTIKAGRCLVSAAERNGMQLVCVVLNDRETYEDSIALLDDAFSTFAFYLLYDNAAEYGVKSDVEGKEISLKASESFYYPLRKEELSLVEIKKELPSFVYLPVKRGDALGNIQIYFANQLLFFENLCSIISVEKSYLDVLRETARRYAP